MIPVQLNPRSDRSLGHRSRTAETSHAVRMLDHLVWSVLVERQP